jgi:radical SAM protein with 4Fe4S-binding SPASM domain
MSTNGLVFDAARVAKRLGQSGLKHLQISLHGSSEKHDRLVGIGGAHETAVTAIKRFSDHIENVSVAMTITTDNLYDIESVIDKALTAGARWIAVHPVMVIGRAKPSHAPEIESVLEVIDQLSEEHKRHLAVMLPPAIVPAWARNTSFGLGYICTFPDMIAIDQEGNIAPCDAFLADKKWHMGNLRYNLLEEILSSGQATEWKNLRENPVGYLKGVCRQCEFLNLCCGGCRALSYMKYNHWGSPDIWCEEAFECGIFPEESLIKN